jgi:nicotinate-nucleotide adenylyltransferase
VPHRVGDALTSVRIGVLGGSFDPVTRAHVLVAEAAADALRLDRVLLIPAARQPFKPEGPEADPDDRVAMLALAVADHARLAVDCREIERGGPSYTIETVENLRHDFPDDELFLLVGADVAREFGMWRDASRIGEFVQVVALTRAGEAPPDSPHISQTISVPPLDVSASGVREAVRQGRKFEDLVPPKVAEYIRGHKLYA